MQMKKKCLVGIIILFVFFAFIPKNDVKARTLYNSKTELFLNSPVSRIYQIPCGAINEFTVYDEEMDLETYDCYDPMLLSPGGGTYIIAQTNATNIGEYSDVSLPKGWLVSSGPKTLNITIPDDVESDIYWIGMDVWIYENTGKLIDTAHIDMYVYVGVNTTKCSIQVLNQETGKPIEGALVDGELGYLASSYQRKKTDTEGMAYFYDLDNSLWHNRTIEVEATGYEKINTQLITKVGQINIFQSYSLIPRSKTGKLIVNVADQFGALNKVDVYIGNGRLVDYQYKSDKNGQIQTELMNPGVYHIIMKKDGYKSLEFDIEMPQSGSDVTINKQLIHTNTTNLTVHVKNNAGKDIANAKIDVNEVTYEVKKNGILSIENLPLNEYMLTIYSPGYVTKKKRIYFDKEMELDVCLDTIDSLPVMDEYDINHKSIDAGLYHTVYINDENKAYGTGYNVFGLLTNSGSVQVNKYITDEVIMAASGYEHQLFLKKDGTVWAAGSNYYGQLGDGTTISKSKLTQVAGLSNVIQIATYENCNLALKQDGTVWGWGYNGFGQLGNDLTDYEATPVQIPNIKNVKQIACGEGSSYFLKKDGTVYGCGDNSVGQLGVGADVKEIIAPAKITKSGAIRFITAGAHHAVAIDYKGLVYGWGNNRYGQLGLNDVSKRYYPEQNPYLSDVKYAAAGYDFTVFCDVEGNVYQCGLVEERLLEKYRKEDYYRPVKVEGLKKISFVSAGYHNVLAEEMDGTIWRWGGNSNGELGDNTTIDSATPIRFDTEKAMTNNTYLLSACNIILDEDIKTNHVSILKKGECRYYRFIAPRTGIYTIQSISTSTDLYGYLLDSDKSQIAYNDDAPTANRNSNNICDFNISRELQAGHTYYIKIKLYSASAVGDCKLKITCPEQTKHSVTKAKNPKLYQALKSNRSTLDIGNTGTISANELEELTGTLFLSGRGITDITGLENCVNIQQLYLDRNEIINIDALSELTNLKILDISDNKLMHLCAVAGMEHLEVLNAARNKIVDIQGITGLKHLRFCT